MRTEAYEWIASGVIVPTVVGKTERVSELVRWIVFDQLATNEMAELDDIERDNDDDTHTIDAKKDVKLNRMLSVMLNWSRTTSGYV